MTIKSYSLVETLVASTIFMVVVVVSLSSYAMIRKTNNQTEDVRSTNQCARQLEDYITAEVRSSNYGERVMGILENRNIEAIPETTSVGNIYIGIVLFKEEGKFEVIYKSADSYYREKKTFTTFPASVNLNPNDNNRLNGADCNAFEAIEADFIPDPKNTFKIKKVVPFAGDTNQNDIVYVVELEDAIYRKKLETQSTSVDRKSFARVYLKVSNNLGEV